jgi:hypothetical protein
MVRAAGISGTSPAIVVARGRDCQGLPTAIAGGRGRPPPAPGAARRLVKKITESLDSI